MADPTGYTIDFNVYHASLGIRSGHGSSYDVTDLLQPYQFQGYELFCDNFYTSPKLFEDLLSMGITATGTLIVNRKGVLKEVQILKESMKGSSTPRGTGYNIRESGSPLVFVVWKDN